jgi:hypothetical protein
VLSKPIGIGVRALLSVGTTTCRKGTLGDNDKLVVEGLEVESRSSVRFVVVFDRDKRSKLSVGRLSAVVDAGGIAEAIQRGALTGTAVWWKANVDSHLRYAIDVARPSGRVILVGYAS